MSERDATLDATTQHGAGETPVTVQDALTLITEIAQHPSMDELRRRYNASMAAGPGRSEQEVREMVDYLRKERAVKKASKEKKDDESD